MKNRTMMKYYRCFYLCLILWMMATAKCMAQGELMNSYYAGQTIEVTFPSSGRGAFQFELSLAKGLSFVPVTEDGSFLVFLDESQTTHTASVHVNEADRLMRCVVYSTTNALCPSDIMIRVKIADDIDIGETLISYCKVLSDGEEGRVYQYPYEIRIIEKSISENIIPIAEDEEVSFDEEITEETDLSNTVIENTYFNMDAGNGDGYDAEEQALILNSTTTAEEMNAVTCSEVGDDAIRDNYNGVIIKLAAGKGTITVDAKTIGTHVLNVQIGKGEPTKVTKTVRGTVDIPYSVTEPTYVYLYASTAEGSAVRLNRAPSAGENSVLLYGYKVTLMDIVPGDADGDTKVDVNDVTSTINYILNKPVATFIFKAADMDKDGKIDVNDVQAIIYKALGK